MNCPACGSLLTERTTGKGVLFLVCPNWAAGCRVSGTPALVHRIQGLRDELEQKRAAPHPVPDDTAAVPDCDPVLLGAFVTKLAQMRIHQSKLNAAKTDDEREAVRKQALEAIK